MSALCELDSVRMMLGIPDGDQRDDALLQRLIGYTSGLFERMTQRKYDEQRFTEYFDIEPNQNQLLLKNYPITSSCGLTRVDDAQAYGSDEFQVKAHAGIVMLLDDTFPVGDRQIVHTYSAGYTSASIPDDVSAAVAVQTCSFYNSVKSRGFKSEKLDALSYSALGDLEPEFKVAVAFNKKMGHGTGG